VGSDEDVGAAPQCPADLPPKLAAEVRRIALSAWRLVGGQGYGRVDMRIDAAGKPWILEVNANPDIAPDAGLARMAAVAGIEYPALVRTLCELGLERNRDGVSVEDGWALAQRLSGVTPSTEHVAPALDLFAVGDH
jgi:hypothetical protein